jgi:membrane-bound inhibitor of C-type lysozyme
MKKHYFLAIFLLLLLGSLVWLLARQEPSLSTDLLPGEEARFADANTIVYQSVEGKILSVEYVGDLARINNDTYHNVVLRQVVAASGAKYEGSQGLSLWTKSDEVRLEDAQTVLFVGQNEVAKVTDNVPFLEEVFTDTTGSSSSTSTVEAISTSTATSTEVFATTTSTSSAKAP